MRRGNLHDVVLAQLGVGACGKIIFVTTHNVGDTNFLSSPKCAPGVPLVYNAESTVLHLTHYFPLTNQVDLMEFIEEYQRIVFSQQVVFSGPSFTTFRP